MDNKQLERIPIFGIILVVIGVALLMRQLNIIRIDGVTLVLAGVIAYGGGMVIRSFAMNIRRSLFFGGLCFFSGILLILGKVDLIEQTPFVYVPGFLVVFGLAFTLLYVYNFKDFHLLVPAFIFLGLGGAFMMTEIGFLYPHDVKEAFANYWPVAIILFGVLILFRRKPDSRQ